MMNLEKTMISLLEKLVEINSYSQNQKGLEKMCAFLKQEFQSLNPDSLKSIKLKNGPALLATKRKKAPMQIYLGGHLDTVFPKNWPIKKNKERFFGPGCCDMKGGLTILLESLRALEKLEVKKHLGWTVFLNPDEEIGSPFSTPLIKDHVKKCDLALLFEPALPNKKLVASRKGSANYRCIAKGKSAHVGRNPDKGICAISKLAHFICAIEKLNRKSVRLFVGTISGGTAGNVIADYAECLLNIRFDRTFPEDKLQELQKKWEIELNPLSFRPPKPFSKTLFMEMRACAHACKDRCEWEDSGGVCDGNVTQNCSVPTIDTLGAEGGHIHTKKEFIYTKSLIKKVAWTSLFLERMAKGEIQL